MSEPRGRRQQRITKLLDRVVRRKPGGEQRGEKHYSDDSKSRDRATVATKAPPPFDPEGGRSAELAPSLDGRYRRHALVCMAQPGVDDGVKHVDSQVDENDSSGDQQNAALHLLIVAAMDRFN